MPDKKPFIGWGIPILTVHCVSDRETIPILLHFGRRCKPSRPDAWSLRVFYCRSFPRLLGAGPIQLNRYCAAAPLTSPAKVLKLPAAVRRLKRRYAEQFMQALSYKTTVRKNADVLNHMLGMFKKQLTEAARQEVVEAIAGYRNGLVPLLEPLALIRHLVRIHRINTLKDQVYLRSYPKELMFRHNI